MYHPSLTQAVLQGHLPPLLLSVPPAVTRDRTPTLPMADVSTPKHLSERYIGFLSRLFLTEKRGRGGQRGHLLCAPPAHSHRGWPGPCWCGSPRGSLFPEPQIGDKTGTPGLGPPSPFTHCHALGPQLSSFLLLCSFFWHIILRFLF